MARISKLVGLIAIAGFAWVSAACIKVFWEELRQMRENRDYMISRNRSRRRPVD